MNIFFLIWNYWPGIEGGSERQARLVASELIQRGHSCTVWSAWQESNWPVKEIKDGVTVQRFGALVPWQNRARRLLHRMHLVFSPWFSQLSPSAQLRFEHFCHHLDFWVMLPVVWLTRWSFMREVLKQAPGLRPSPNIIHLHEPSWLGGFAVQLGETWSVSVLCQEATNPTLPVLGYDVPFRRRLDILRRQAHFIAMAPYLADDLRAKGISSQRIHVLPNGVNIPPEASSPGESRFALYVGNFSQGAHWKAFDILFESWALVHQQIPDVQLLLLGGGDRAIWEQYVARLGCEDSVRFLGRVEDPGRFYRKASMLILPSRVEGMSNALLEAQSWGVPCVVSDIPGNRAIVENDVNGIVVPVDDEVTLASAILRLVDDPELREYLGRNARLKMEKEFDSKKIMDRLVLIYQEFLTNEDNVIGPV